MLAAVGLLVALTGVLLYLFLRTNLGTAMRATGDNAQMIRALGVNEDNMIVFGLALSNGLIALSGALLAQYQGFADVQMGIGMVVWGLASVIIGEALVGTRPARHCSSPARSWARCCFACWWPSRLRWGLNPNDLKLITAAFVFCALIVPAVRAQAETAAERACLSFRASRKTFNPGTPNEVRALRGVTLQLEDGSFLIIIGTNGSGKSTLLNAVAGTFLVDAGRSGWRDATSRAGPSIARAELIGRVFQNPFSGTAPNLSIAENLALAARRGRRRGLGWALEPVAGGTNCATASAG